MNLPTRQLLSSYCKQIRYVKFNLVQTGDMRNFTVFFRKIKSVTYHKTILNFKAYILDLYRNLVRKRELLNITANELTLAQDRIRVLGKLTATERMANFILNISDQRARIKWQDNPVSLPMNRQDIADYLGLTIATVSREITRLKTSNVIKVLSASQIYINDRTKLSLLCN